MKRALRTKDEFLANMSHELRTPLNAILGLSESLLEQTAGPLNERQNKYLSTVNESGHHLLELINDILDLAKIEAGKLEIRPVAIYLHDMAADVIAFFAPQAQARRIGLRVVYGSKRSIALKLDSERLRQVLVNLVGNAIKYTDRGEVVLIV